VRARWIGRRYCFLLLVAALTFVYGCSSSTPITPTEEGAESPTSEAAEEPHDEFAPLEAYDAPLLEEIEAQAEWIDQPVKNLRQILRDRLAKEAPSPGNAAEVLRLRNKSEEDNAKIYAVMRQLPTSDDEVDWEATLVHSTAGDAKSLNPLMINLAPEMTLLELTGLQLIGFDHAFTPHAVAWAVKSWQVSKDHMMDKFILRDDLTWSDGKPVTAHDVAFSFRTIMDPQIPIPAVRSNTQHLRWVEAYDDHTVVIFHKKPMASWTENIQFPIVPKHIYEESLKEDPTMINSDYHVKYDREPVTCGPYEYVKRVQGQETVVRRRESWYVHNGKQVRDKPFFKEIRMRVITDPNTMLLALKAGDVDESMLSAEQWVAQTDDDDFYRRNTKMSGVEWTEAQITWNCKTPFFSDKRVRQAMAYAYNHEEMRKSIFYDLVTPGTGVFHPDAWMASQSIKPYEQDLDKAEQLLDEAGWVDSDGDGVRDKEINGRNARFEFTLITFEQPNAIRACTLLKNNLDQLGIICHVKPTEFTVKTQLAIEHKFQALMGVWGTGTDPSTLVNIFGTGQGRNFGSYSNLQVDELFEAGQLEFDRTKRAGIYAQIQEILWEDQPNMWMFHRKSLYGVSKDLRGFNFSPRDPYGVQPGLLGLWKPKDN
jgi:peptide/nickel transport system substrate-binding protein